VWVRVLFTRLPPKSKAVALKVAVVDGKAVVSKGGALPQPRSVEKGSVEKEKRIATSSDCGFICHQALKRRAAVEGGQISGGSAQSRSSDITARTHRSSFPAAEFLACEVCALLSLPAGKADTCLGCGNMPRRLSQNACRFLLEALATSVLKEDN
jgi:hypothetical protein